MKKDYFYSMLFALTVNNFLSGISVAVSSVYPPVIATRKLILNFEKIYSVAFATSFVTSKILDRMQVNENPIKLFQSKKLREYYKSELSAKILRKPNTLTSKDFLFAGEAEVREVLVNPIRDGEGYQITIYYQVPRDFQNILHGPQDIVSADLVREGVAEPFMVKEVFYSNTKTEIPSFLEHINAVNSSIGCPLQIVYMKGDPNTKFSITSNGLIRAQQYTQEVANYQPMIAVPNPEPPFIPSQSPISAAYLVGSCVLTTILKRSLCL